MQKYAAFWFRILHWSTERYFRWVKRVFLLVMRLLANLLLD
jgi:hypothetical protein